jgi:hypothetical protein
MKGMVETIHGTQEYYSKILVNQISIVLEQHLKWYFKP